MIPLYKRKPNKNEISNYRPVSVINTFSKFYEKVIKKQLVRFMEEYCSPLISAYRTNAVHNILLHDYWNNGERN